MTLSEDIDAPENMRRHVAIIRSKKFLKRTYEDHYEFFRRGSKSLPAGEKVELGSGSGFLKEVITDVITTDIVPLPGIDRVASAVSLPFADGSVAALYLLDVLHHVSDAAAFFAEAERCLAQGGKILLVEPANTPWGRFIYRNFHHEPFEPEQAEWRLKAEKPLSVANGALPWMILVRDRAMFEKRFPQLAIRRVAYVHPFRYLLSGGLSKPQLVPSCAYGFVRWVEDVLLAPFSNTLGMFMQIEIVKR